MTELIKEVHQVLPKHYPACRHSTASGLISSSVACREYTTLAARTRSCIHINTQGGAAWGRGWPWAGVLRLYRAGRPIACAGGRRNGGGGTCRASGFLLAINLARCPSECERLDCGGKRQSGLFRRALGKQGPTGGRSQKKAIKGKRRHRHCLAIHFVGMSVTLRSPISRQTRKAPFDALLRISQVGRYVPVLLSSSLLRIRRVTPIPKRPKTANEIAAGSGMTYE